MIYVVIIISSWVPDSDDPGRRAADQSLNLHFDRKIGIPEFFSRVKPLNLETNRFSGAGQVH
jgi:hypothetical protein